MDIKEIQQTETWILLQKGINFARLKGIYTDTDTNHRFYNGDQWEGLKVTGIEPVCINFIKPVVKYKVGTINQNLWAIKYSADNFESPIFQDIAQKTCDLLNKKASKIWEFNDMDRKCMRIARQSAINDECIVYVRWEEGKKDKKTKQTAQGMPVLEILNKNDVYYGNEQDQEIQDQPYILIKRRLPVSVARSYAKGEGLEADQLLYIIGDKDVQEEAGDDSKEEVNDMVTLVTKLYKKDGIVYRTESTKYMDIIKEVSIGIDLYPLDHFIWEEKEGSARGEGEVRRLIPNQMEANKTLMRRLLTAKNTAYPQKVVLTSAISNMEDVDKVGGIIKVSGNTIDDVDKVFKVTQPASMSVDVEKVQDVLVNMSRELAGAGDVATGDINPEIASGRAILAVQQASQMPINEQITNFKSFLEGLARIFIAMIKKYSGKEGLSLEEEYFDEEVGAEKIRVIRVPAMVLEQLKVTSKIDITPKSPLDKMAQDMSIENLLTNGMISLEEFAKLLDYDSVMPKQKVAELIKDRKEAERKILEIQGQAQELQAKVSQFINDPEMQQQYMADTGQEMPQEQQSQTPSVPVQ